jgi:signal-transduction protein with cAMP-binding, CBS, and nucleotidyltransferase domain
MEKKETDVLTPGADEQAAGLGGAGSDLMSPGAGEQGMPAMIPEPGGKVRDIMTAAPVGVYYSQTIGETARVMRDSQVGAVLVVNEGALAGLVTDRDLVIRGLAEGEGPDSPVGPLCTGDLIGVAADADLHQAAQLMRENAVRRLPVINDGQVVGIVSMGDIAISADADSALAAVSRADANI